MQDTWEIRPEDHRQLSAEIVTRFYCRHATWRVPTDVQVWARMLRHSNAIVAAWQGEALIGMARALSDRVRYATIVDVLVHPDHRRQGIGRTLIEALMDHPNMRVLSTYLGTPDMEAFYASCGFECVNDKGSWMLRMHLEHAPDLVLPVPRSHTGA